MRARSGSIIDRIRTAAIIRAVLLLKEPSLLEENGGLVNHNSHGLIQSIWHRNGWVKRAMTSKRRSFPMLFIKDAIAFQQMIHTYMECNGIPDALVVNADETAAPIIPQSRYTMAVRGSNAVSGVAIDDKRCLTVMLAGAMNGAPLGIQMIYRGICLCFFRGRHFCVFL